MSIKKILLLFVIFATMSTSYLFGKTIDENTAKTVGMNFLKMKGINISSISSLDNTYTATGIINGNVTLAYFVFNVAASHSFVIVSADDNIQPILAYSNESLFDNNNMSSSTRYWINGYKNQILKVLELNLPAQNSVKNDWTNYLASVFNNSAAKTTNVAPLVATTWDQAPGINTAGYYNDSCPVTPGNSQAVTGCVATAMAQVMKFWNWPVTGIGYHQYWDTTYPTTPSPGILLSANFGNTSYNWAAMPNTLTNHNAAVAQLMYHAGVSVNMGYTTNESGSYVVEKNTAQLYFPDVAPICAEYALKSFFRYKPSLRGVLRFGLYGGGVTYVDSMTTTSWISMLQAELNAGRPMLYSGSDTTGGHCWVCDGYQTSGNMFHFNWGWSGYQNGYFTVNNIAVAGVGTGGGTGDFNNQQAVVIGIMPDSFPNTAGNLKLSSHLNIPVSSPMHYKTPLTANATILNSGTSTFNGDFSAQVFDTLNNLIGTIQTLTGKTINAGASSSYTFGPTTCLGMIPMDYYHICIMYRNSGTTNWKNVANNGQFVNYNTAIVRDDTDLTLFSPIHITTPLPVVSGANFSLIDTIINFGTDTFKGTFQAVMINIGTGTLYPIQTSPTYNLPPYYYTNGTTFTNSTFTAPNGKYALCIQHQYSTGNYYTTGNTYYENPIMVHVGPTTEVLSIKPEDNIYVFPNPAKDMITIMPDGLNITEVAMYDIQGNKVEKQIKANGNAGIIVPVANIASGVYFFNITTEAGMVTKKIVVTH